MIDEKEKKLKFTMEEVDLIIQGLRYQIDELTEEVEILKNESSISVKDHLKQMDNVCQSHEKVCTKLAGELIDYIIDSKYNIKVNNEIIKTNFDEIKERLLQLESTRE